METRHKGIIMMLAVCILWASVYGITKIALAAMTPMLLTAIIFIASSIIVAVVYRKHLKFLNKKIIKDGLVLGIILTVATIFFNVALVYLTEAEGAIYEAITIPFVPLIVLLFTKEKVSKKKLICAAIVFLAIVYMNYNASGFTFEIGALYGMLAAIGFAIHIIVTNSQVRKEDELDLVMVQLFSAGIFSLVATFLFENIHVNMTPSSTIAFIALVFIVAIGYTLKFEAGKILDSTEIGILQAPLPVFGILAAIVFFGNALTIKEFIGCTVVISVIIFMECEPREKQKIIYEK